MEVLETSVYAEDLEKARAFYEGVLGLPCFQFKPPRHAFFRAGRGVFLVFNPKLTEKETQNLHLFTAGMSMLGDHLKRATGFPSYEGCHETSSPIPTLDHPGPHANPPPAGILEGPVVPFPHRSRQG
ncbi:uncharacterized protein TTMY_2039 [Thermus thermophilus]|nr:uncharacterized protein TTMY_2039 [Thermus thermophilus]BDB10650.1 hypothetical protein TthTMY_03890 [Thermus thermophilus]